MGVADNLVLRTRVGVPVWANELSPGSYDWTSWQYNFANFDNLISLLETRGSAGSTGTGP